MESTAFENESLVIYTMESCPGECFGGAENAENALRRHREERRRSVVSIRTCVMGL